MSGNQNLLLDMQITRKIKLIIKGQSIKINFMPIYMDILNIYG